MLESFTIVIVGAGILNMPGTVNNAWGPAGLLLNRFKSASIENKNFLFLVNSGMAILPIFKGFALAPIIPSAPTPTETFSHCGNELLALINEDGFTESQ